MLAQVAPYLKDVSLLGLVLLAIMGGWLIPRWTYRNMVALYKAQAAFYEEAWRDEKEVSNSTRAQVGQLLQYAQTGNELLAALHKASQAQSRES